MLLILAVAACAAPIAAAASQDDPPAAQTQAPTNAPGAAERSVGAETVTLAPAAAPELGHSVGVAAGSGTVLVRLPGSSRAIARHSNLARGR